MGDFFEGAEKLLEVWWSEPSEADVQLSDGSPEDDHSLLRIPDEELAELCRVAGCQILSRIEVAGRQKALLLSESSLFLSRRRAIFKTCGQTHLLGAVPLLLALARRYAGLARVDSVFYSRKNFLRPELQRREYRDPDLAGETAALDAAFGRKGTAFCMGALNGERWYLYCLESERGEADLTLEVLMWDLDESVAEVFSTCGSSDADAAYAAAGLEALSPSEALLDHHLFIPSGYSANLLLPASDAYATVHVTPQPLCSYASFETNLLERPLSEVLDSVLCIFRPRRFVLSLYGNRAAQRGHFPRALPEVDNFHSANDQVLSIGRQSRLLFAHYECAEEAS